MKFFPSLRIFPQLGAPAGRPAPRKLSAASWMMDEANTKVICTMMEEMMLGAMCSQRIRVSVAPVERRAST